MAIEGNNSLEFPRMDRKGWSLSKSVKYTIVSKKLPNKAMGSDEEERKRWREQLGKNSTLRSDGDETFGANLQNVQIRKDKKIRNYEVGFFG